MASAPATTIKRESVESRTRRLAAARRRATALLGAVTVLFVVVTAIGGGVADWFAVTALFRHPLGLPIPHTAVIVERKDQFAATLGQFVQENFLNGDVLAERIGSAQIASRVAGWLTDEDNAARFAGHAADMFVRAADGLRDEDVQRALTAELTRAADSIEVAPLAGRIVGIIIAEGHHTEVFNTIVNGADRYLADHHEELRERFESEAPRWVPDMVYGRAFDRLYARLRERLPEMAANPGDETRRPFEEWIAGSPSACRPRPSCASGGSGSSATCSAAPCCGTGPLRCGRTSRRRCGSRRPTRNRSCAAGWRPRSARAADASAPTRGCRRASSGWSSRPPGRSPTSSTTSWPGWSPGPSSAGTPSRPRASSSCCSDGTCSSSGSTARWSGPASGWRCTRSRWHWPRS